MDISDIVSDIEYISETDLEDDKEDSSPDKENNPPGDETPALVPTFNKTPEVVSVPSEYDLLCPTCLQNPTLFGLPPLTPSAVASAPAPSLMPAAIIYPGNISPFYATTPLAPPPPSRETSADSTAANTCCPCVDRHLSIKQLVRTAYTCGGCGHYNPPSQRQRYHVVVRGRVPGIYADS